MRRYFDIQTSGGWSYPVLAGAGSSDALANLWQPNWTQAVLIGDSHTADLFFPATEKTLANRVSQLIKLSFTAGDEHKSRASKEALEDQMLRAGITRHACLIAVGGGVALDLGGFVAATYLRGIPHINVATSLLAQVDAAIGGKTGVNTPLGKNLIGAFYPPRAVLIDVDALSTLPEAELCNGLAECVKHAVIADAALFSDLTAWAKKASSTPSEALIVRAAQIKSEVVMEDEHESGKRAILNFGHTIAHGIEAATHHSVAHGKAVAAGMVVEAQLAQDMNVAKPGLRAAIETLLEQIGLPTRPQCAYQEAAAYLTRDKKNRDGEIHFSLPAQIGQMALKDNRFTQPAPEAAIQAAWDKVASAT